ncbi:MAG: Rod shape-determining protein MreC [Humibacillus sp.]|nr:Rod shape-determining protein MreC [Humibacillus sp.]
MRPTTPASSGTRATQRRLLVVLVAVTVALLGADLAGSGVAAAVRSAGGTVLGPVQRLLSAAPVDELVALRSQNVLLQATVDAQQRRLDEQASVTRLLGSAATRDHRLVAARVVATGLSPLGGRSVTLDVGTRDGVTADSSVVTAEGLVGRVVAVAPWTCDVQVLGSTGSVVGVRVGPAGTLATVGPPSSTDRESRPRGSLTLSFVQPGTPVVGDIVTTLGSPDERPYAAGLVVGAVTAVDPDRGQLTRTATVRPVVDPDALDVVAVLVPQARTAARTETSGAPTSATRATP